MAVLMAFLSVAPVFTAHAEVAPVSMATNFQPYENASSYMYFNTLYYCVATAQLRESIAHDNLSESDASAGNWFTAHSGEAPAIGYFLGSTDNGGLVGCDNASTWLPAAASLWGYSPIELLCASGANRKNGTNCINGGGIFTGNQGGRTGGDLFWSYLSAAKFEKAVVDKVYGGANPNDVRANGSDKSAAAQYAQDRNVFFTGCIGSINPTEDPGTAQKDQFSYSITNVDDAGTSAIANYYSKIGKSKTDSVPAYVSGSKMQNVSMTCGELATALTGTNAMAFSNIALKTAGGLKAPNLPGSTGSGTTKPTCGSVVSGTGWILCPILNSLTGLNDLMWKLVDSLLVTSPLQQSDPIYQAWNTIRGIANIVFVIFFLVIIMSQLTGAGITNYGVKKLLPRLIICAILVNASFVIVQLSVDLANLVGKGLYDIILGFAPAYTANWTSFVEDLLITVGVSGVAGVSVVLAMGGTSLFWLILPSAAIATLGFFAAVLTLAFRQAAIPILAILAPFAFVCYLLPNTEQWFKEWKDLMVSMLMLYPLAAVVFAGARFASNLIYAQGGWWFHLIGLVIMGVPLFSLPFIARQGGAILSSVGGALNKMAEKARAPLSNVSKDFRDTAKARYLNDDPSTMTKRQQQRRDVVNKMGLGGLRTASRGVADRRQGREWRREADTSAFKAQVAENKVNGLNGKPIDANTAFKRMEAAKQYMGAVQKGAEADVMKENKVVNPEHGGIKLNDKKYESELAYSTASDKSTARLQGLKKYNAKRATAERAKTQANTATKEAEDRTENSAGMLQIRVDDAQAEANLDNTKRETEAVIAEASTDAVAAPGSKLASLTPESRTGLHTAQLQKTVTASRAASAQRTQAQEYEKAVAPTVDIVYTDAAGNPLLDRAGDQIPTGQKEITVTAATIEAAGIDNSTARVQALAQQAGDKRQAEESTAQQVLVEATTDIAGKIATATTDLATSLAPAQRNTDDGAISTDATTQILLTTGQKGLDSLIKTTAQLPGGDISKSAEAIRSRVLKSGVKGKSSALDQYGIDQNHRRMAEILRDSDTYTRLNIGQLASQGDYDLEAAFACGGINPIFAQEIITNLKNFPDINGRKLEIFQAAATQVGVPAGTPNPALLDPKSRDFVARKLPPL